MSAWDTELYGNQSGGHSRVHIPYHDDAVWPEVQEHAFELDHHSTGLCAVKSRADAEVDVWARNAQVVEEYLRHRCVVVLAGVHQLLIHLRMTAKCVHDRRDLHEVGPRADDVNEPHRAGH